MSNLELFNPINIDDQAAMLAYHLPIGRVWSAAFDPDSNLGKLIRGLGIEFYRLEVLTQKISVEMDINQINELILEWEKSVGIPDTCFSINTDLEARRLQVLQKFSNFGGVQKASDFVRVAAVFGFNISVTPATPDYLFPLEFPILFFADVRAVTHTILVAFIDNPSGETFFPLDFPLPFQTGAQAFLQCIFNVLAPANVQVLFPGDLI